MRGAPTKTRQGKLVVQDEAQQRSIDLKTSVVFDETHFPEFVREEIHPAFLVSLALQTLGGLSGPPSNQSRTDAFQNDGAIGCAVESKEKVRSALNRATRKAKR